MFYDFLNLISPNSCAACNNNLLRGEKLLCETCSVNIVSGINNATTKQKLDEILNNRVPYKNAQVLFQFDNRGKVQNLLHNIKYRGDSKTAYALGKLLGAKIAAQLIEIDAITYVPLHKSKEAYRGFNQSKLFAEGISKIIKKPVISTLKRPRSAETQTRMNKENRWQNVSNAFELDGKKSFRAQHLLLVDDVITTGATTEACYHTLKSIGTFHISLVYIAIAS
jgi:ComF family protein